MARYRGIFSYHRSNMSRRAWCVRVVLVSDESRHKERAWWIPATRNVLQHTPSPGLESMP